MNIMLKWLYRVLMVAGALFFSGCATLIADDLQQIEVNTNIKGAEVYVGDSMVGKTPFKDKVSRQDVHEAGGILVLKSGYESQVRQLNTGSKAIDSLFWWNLISGGTVGMLTDWSTGAMWEISPDKFYFELLKNDASATELEKHKLVVEVKDFIFKNYGKIQKELKSGAEGGYSASLIGMTFVPPKKLIEISNQAKGPADFAERIVKNIRL